MRIYKAKVEDSKGGRLQVLPVPPLSQYIRVQAIYYSSDSPNNILRLLDGDEDEVFYITGSPNKRTIPLDGQIACKLPLYYIDEDMDGGNKIVIFGEVVDNA